MKTNLQLTRQTSLAIVKTALSAVVLGIAVGYAPAHATEHALILTIGNYADPSANLKGPAHDAGSARRIAQAMGVSPGNITELRDGSLNKQGMANAFDALNQRVQPGDGVFVYYSGHGGQIVATKSGGKKCTDGMVSQELQLFEDEQLEGLLQKLSSRAGRVVMMNDSCFSGGASSTKSLSDAAPKSKRFKFADSGNPDYVCSQATNMKSTRNLFTEQRTANMLYIAAASNEQVAYDGERGSLATMAWEQCLIGPDRDRSGVLSGEEMRACAQQVVNRNPHGFVQTITLVGNGNLPLSFSSSGSSSAGGGAQPVNASAALESMRNGATPAIGVDLQLARSQMRITQPGRPGDMLDFSVRTSTPGYLYVFHIGSDGKTFDLLFPNKQDSDNRISAGMHNFPRAGWAVRAGGPVGTSYLMAVVAEAPRKFSELMSGQAGPFSQADATGGNARNLYSEAVGVNQSNPGRFGASRVVAMQEVQ